MGLDDAATIQRHLPRWEVARLLANAVPWPYLEDGALRDIREIVLPSMERGEAWHWTIRRKAAPEGIVGAIDAGRGRQSRVRGGSGVAAAEV